MKKWFNIVMLTLLLLGQTILGPIGTVWANEGDDLSSVGEQQEGENDPGGDSSVADPSDNDSGKVDPSEGDNPNDNIDLNDGDLLDEQDGEDSDDPSSDGEANTSEDDEGDENTEAPEEITEEDEENKLEKEANKLERKVPNLMGAPSVEMSNLITNVEIWSHPDGNGQPTAESKNISDIRPGTGEALAVEYAWELQAGHPYSEGDTFTFQLPDKFEFGLELDGKLSGASTEVGSWTLTPAGQITFTFNEEINDEKGFTGNFYVWRKFDANKLEAGTKQDIIFEYGTVTKNIPVHFKGSNTGITKAGTAHKAGNVNNKNSDEIKWTVDFNKGEETITGAKFKDTLPTGLTIDNVSNIEVQELVVNRDGTVRPGAPSNNYTPSLVGNGFELEFTGSINKAYRVTYTTKVTSPSGAGANYSPTYTNNVAVTGTTSAGSFNESKSADVPVTFNRPLTKISSYNAADQEITWTIQYNYNEQTITNANNTLQDRFTNTHELKGGVNGVSVTSVAIDANGNPGIKTPVDASGWITLATGAGTNGFDLVVPTGSNTAYEITYTTKATDRVLGSNNIANTVEIENYATAVKSQDTGQEVFKKNNGSINYNTKKITWTIDLNKDKHEMTNVVITDKFKDQGLKLDEDTFEIPGLTEGTDYTLTPDSTFEEGFKITFNKDITENHIITYVTDFDPTHFSSIDVKTHKYTNKAEIVWDEMPTPKPIFTTANASAETNNYMKKNGNKTGAYDATTKVITWRIDVNFNRHTIPKAVVRDFYTGPQNFVEGSLKVEPLTITTGGGVTPGTAISDYDVDYDVKDNGKDGFELRFKNEIDSAYRITYQTDLKGLPVLKDGYSNQATLYDQNAPTTVLFNEKADVLPQHHGEYVNKQTPIQGTGADQVYATWTVNINRSQSFVAADAFLTDTLSTNQILQQGSFKLYQPTVATNGTLGNVNTATLVDPSKYTVTFATDETTGAESFTLTFNEAIENAYILQYKSFINANHGANISNNVTFAGHSDGSGTASHQANREASFSGGAGGVVFPSGTAYIQIQKVDADSKEPLKGVIFDLYDESGTNLLEAGLETDEDGKITTSKKYKFKNYMFKETHSLNGYLVENKIVEFKDGSIVYEIENRKDPKSVELTKVDSEDNTKKLPGAVFELQERNGTLISTHTTDGNGKITVVLSVGDYQFVETEAPAGYKLDSTPIPFEITASQATTVTKTVPNEPYKGGLVVTKEGVDLDTNTSVNLQGVEFELSNGVVTYTETTDADGKVEFNNLRYGSYTLTEITGKPGYLIAANSRTVIIDSETAKEIVVENNKINQSVKLIKTQLNNSARLLEGAEFKLVKDDGAGNFEVVVGFENLVTDANGEISVSNMDVGNYQFIETKAPSGYRLDATPVEFEIGENQTETVEVKKENRRIPPTIPTPTCNIFTVTVKQDSVVIGENVELTLKDESEIVVAAGTTNADGKIVFAKADLPEGTYTVYDKDDAAIGTIIVSYTEGECQAEIDLPAKTCDAFTLTVKQLGTPAAENTAVTLKDSEGKSVATGETGAAGTIQFDKADLPAGTYTAYDADDNEIDTVTVSYEVGNCQAEIDLLPKTCDAFTLTVKQSGELVEEGTTVTLKDSEGKTVATGTTDAAGTIQFAKVNLPAGKYTAYDADDNEIGMVTVSYEVGNCQAEIDLLPKTCNAFTLTVKQSGELVEEGTTVTLKDSEGKTVATGTTDAAGTIQFAKSDLPAGTYTAFDAKDNEVGTVTVSYAGGNCQAEIDLLPKTCDAFTLTVKQSGELVEEGTTVTLKDSEGKTVATGTTNATGTIQFAKADLPAGTYTVYDENDKAVGSVIVSYEEGKCQATIDVLPKVCEQFTLTVANKPFANVVVKDLIGNVILTGVTDNEGNVTFTTLLPQGSYVVTVNNDVDGHFNVTENCSATVTLESNPGNGGGSGGGGGGGGGGGTPPTTPVDPNKPGESGKPGDPNKPGESGKPGDPNKPGESGKPGDPNKPGESGKPGDPNKPGESGKPGDPNKPGESGKPGDPNKPGESGKPGDPNKPGESGKPGDPNKPGESGKPGDPNKPGESGKPVDPNKSGESGKPVDPNKPGESGKPSDPNTSGESIKPGDSNELGESGKLGSPNKLGESSNQIDSKTPTNGKILPQTGEAYPIVPMAAGLTLILAGLWMLRRKKLSFK